MEDGEGRNRVEFETPNIRRRVIVTALVAVMVFSGLSILLGSRGAAAAGTSGPLIFKAASTALTVTTTNILNIGYFDEFLFTYASYDTLLTVDGDFARVNWLAYKYDTPAVIGGNTYRFYLVRDACFVDPTYTGDMAAYCAAHPLTASDVAFTYNMIGCMHGVPNSQFTTCKKNPSRSLDSYVERFSNARVVDPYTVDITFTQVYAPWFSTFSVMPILPQFQWGPVFNNGAGDPNSYILPAIIGSGPLTTVRADVTIIELHKNRWGLRGPWWGTSDYNLEIRPDVVQYIAYGTQDNSLLALKKGEVDLDRDPGTSNYVGAFSTMTVGGLPVQRYALASIGFVYEIPNTNAADPAIRTTTSRYAHGNNNPALLRQDVRTAVHMVVDSSQLATKALQGLGRAGESFMALTSPWYLDVPPSREKNFDPVAARALLNANGWVYNGTYAIATSAGGFGQLKLEPNAPPGVILAADWVCNGDPFGTVEGKYKGTPGADANGYCQDGKIATGPYDGELLRFRFATFTAAAEGPEWERMYRFMQGWAAIAGMRYMDGSNGECGTANGCGLLTDTQMNSLWTSLDYDLWIWDWGLAPTGDPSGVLWLESTMATEAIYADNGYSDPYYDAQYNDTLQILDTNCRRYGAASCTGSNAPYATVNFTGNGALSGYAKGQKYTLPYTGTDGMLQQLYDFASYNILVQLAAPFVFHELTWSGFGDWNAHPGLPPDETIYWLYFQISPNSAKAPIVSSLPSFQALSGKPVTLTALATDSDGPSPLNYTWDLDESADISGDGIPNNDAQAWGPVITITAPTITSPIVTYGINVRVTDGQWTQKVRSTLTVIRDSDPTKAPDVRGVSFTPGDPWLSALAKDTVTLFGSAASRAGGTLSYKWTFGDGTSDTSNKALVQHDYTSTGTFTATVFVTDSANGLKSQFSTVVEVGTNFFPFVSDQPTIQVEANSAVNFTALASDRNKRDVVTYVWDFGDGTPTATGTKVSHTYALATSSLPQPLTYSLAATDSLGQQTKKAGQVFVAAPVPNTAPNIVASSLKCLVNGVDCGSTTIYEHQKVTVTFQAYDAEGNPLTSSYQLGGAQAPITPGQSFDATAKNQVVTFSQDAEIPTSSNTLRITAIVTDTPLHGTGSSNSVYITIAVKANSVPVLLSPGLVGTTVNFGTRVTYSVKPSDGNDASLSYRMDFGDGTSLTGTAFSNVQLNIPHDYAIAGDMNVVLTLTDPHGASSTYTATTTIRGTLGSFPFPFVDGTAVSGNLVIGVSTLHLGVLTAASTIDVVGGVAIGGATGALTSTGLLGGLLDTDAVAADLSRVTATGNLMGLGGRGNNGFTRLVNPNLPVRLFLTTDVCQVSPSRGIFASETKLCYYNTGVNPDGSVDTYGFFSINYNSIAGRYELVAAGLSGFATQAMTQLIALNALGPLPNGNVLTGTGVVVKFHDQNADNIFETYQVVDGSGGAVKMASPAPMLKPGSSFPATDLRSKTAQLFALGLSQVHGVAVAASTIDVVGGVSLGAKMGRDAKKAGTGIVWSALDQDLVSLDGKTLLNTVDNLVALGGRGNNLVTRYYNPSLIVRFALNTTRGDPTTDGTGRGIYNNYSLNNWPTSTVFKIDPVTGQPTSVIDYVQTYAMDSYFTDTINGGRTVEVVAGLSGFATRQVCVSLAGGSPARGADHGIVVSLKDIGGDNTYEQIGIADRAP